MQSRSKRDPARPNRTPDNQRALYQKLVFGEEIDEQGRRADALLQSPNFLAAKVGDRLARCCAGAVVVETKQGSARIVERRCNSRCCCRCSKIRSLQVMARALRVLEKMDAPAFITLTVRSNDDPLRAQLKKLRHDFAELRRSTGWKTHVRGGIYVTEITLNHETGQWHPHLHIVADMTYWLHRDMVTAWAKCVGDQAGVDIKRISSRKVVAMYVAKYSAKSAKVEDLPTSRLPEWAAELHGSRMVQTFGSAHAVKVEENERDFSYIREIDFANDLARDAANGDGNARLVLHLLRTEREISIENYVKLRPECGASCKQKLESQPLLI